eukprot:166287_1
MAGLPIELKQLKRFIREAKKTEKVSPVIAYYCRLYAIQEAMKLDESKKTMATKQWMSNQMGELEQNKVDMSRDEAKQKITTMAHNVFKHADEVDRAGKANKTTAAAFNSAFVFYTILKQFGERDETIVEAGKYCMFKVTDILKALKEGRTPKPGPPGDDPNDELNQELNALNGANVEQKVDSAPTQPTNYGGNINNNNNNFNQPTYNQPPVQPTYNQPPAQPTYNQPPVQPQQPTYNQPPRAKPQPQTNYNTSEYYVNNGPQYNYQKQLKLPQFENKVTACVEAEKVLKEAMAALRFEDVDTAIKKAEEAIAILRPHNI